MKSQGLECIACHLVDKRLVASVSLVMRRCWVSLSSGNLIPTNNEINYVHPRKQLLDFIWLSILLFPKVIFSVYVL